MAAWKRLVLSELSRHGGRVHRAWPESPRDGMQACRLEPATMHVLKSTVLARIFYRLTGQAHERPAITSLRLLAVLNGL